MSNLPPNPFNATGLPLMNVNPGPQLNHNQQYSQVPVSQLPPGCGSLKRDANSNTPLPPLSTPANSNMAPVNNYNQSASNSPAFNHPGVMPLPHVGLQSTPMRSPMSQTIGQSPNHNVFPPQNVPSSVDRQKITPVSPVPNLSSLPPKHINNAPPLISSSHRLPLMNADQYPVTSNLFPPSVNRPPVSVNSGPINPPFGHQGPPVSKPPLGLRLPPQSTIPFSGPPTSGPVRNSPLIPGPPTSAPPMSTGSPNCSGLPSGPVTSGPTFGPPRPFGVNGPNQNGPPMPPILGQGLGPTSGPITGVPPGHMGPPILGPPGPQMNQYPGPYKNGPQGPPNHINTQMGQTPPLPQQQLAQMPPRPKVALIEPQVSQTSVPPGPPTGPLGPPNSNMQGRYPQMQQSNYTTQQPSLPQQLAMGQYPQQYNTQALAQQMGALSVTKQGFDQLWGHHMVDLLTCRNILPEYPEDPPEIKLTHQFADSPNCSPEIFRCTVNKIPETNSLLQKSRLPLGILIHPFKDLNHLPVIQCTSIVRCRSCRTYINPFVYFVDAKRWKCNLCYRVNDLPEEFQYDPVSKSYGDPSRRPEIKSATIEFIAPGEYMLRPPQPAVYLFLMDVSQIARDSGYLQVLCEILKNSLDQLPGDARTQVGFICYDAHVHYYLMSDGLTRPKEMTVLDIDDVFLPSPESLLVNLGERRELIRELLSTLPQRHTGPGVPSCALGAALQAAYKLMAPTGGRITVFQTCLPNVGPGALQPREDPNARSAKDVQHLNPATDFYKRLALDCSGAQIAVDLFLLNSQYSDLATLSGMSKFSAGSVYHLPLFKATRTHQAEQFKRVLLRYLTRKIGFEAVMRVRCTRGITIHTFHGNFFVRSTDLLSLPNVSPDAGFGMQLTIEESLSDLQQVCFQAALLYTSSKGERRIRVHTLALPIANNLTEVLHSADQQCIIGLLSKMAVDRCATASMSEAREALTNVGVDALSAHRLAQNLPVGAASSALHAPLTLRLLPLYLLALLKRKAFRTGTSTRLDDRVADMCDMKTWPLSQLLRAVHPDLYPLLELRQPDHDPPRLHLSAERISSSGAYLLDDGETMIIYVGHQVTPAFLSDTFGVTAFSQLPDEAKSLPRIEGESNDLLHAFIERLNDDRPYASNLLLLKDNSPNRQLFTERLIEDRVENSFSYYEFLQHIKMQVK